MLACCHLGANELPAHPASVSAVATPAPVRMYRMAFPPRDEDNSGKRQKQDRMTSGLWSRTAAHTRFRGRVHWPARTIGAAAAARAPSRPPHHDRSGLGFIAKPAI